MILTTPFCPYGPLLMEAVREKAEGVINKPTKVVLGTEFWSPSMMPEDLRPDWGIY
jgi:metal-sulfur cluster biosynthetic enzyme